MALAQLSVLELVVGERSAAVAHANEALKESASAPVEEQAAETLAFGGNEAKALALADDISRRRPNDTQAQFVFVPMIKALVALQRGNYGQAMDLLDTAAVYARAIDGLHYVRGLTYLRAGKGNEAVQEFQKILDLQGFFGPDIIVTLAHLGLGQAYALQKDDAHARIAYQDFLAIWKDADADLPLLKQAKAEYARLQ
jgi:tetratricopeptide (TPR) repeat protein